MPASIAHIDLGAIAHNVATLAARAPGSLFCAVVKADGYGHGAVAVGRAALAAGADWLAVAHVDEARQLRAAGIEAPVLLLSEPRAEDVDHAIALGLRVTAFRPGLIEALGHRARALGAPDIPVHLKVDTGMRRIGCEPSDAVAVARSIVATPGVRLEGTMTHLATADEPDVATTDVQLDRFQRAMAAMEAEGMDPGLRHAANSAGTIAFPAALLDLVRVGIALYGIPPAPSLASAVELRPALRWSTAVSMVKAVPAGDGVSYGHRHRFEQDTVVATVPVGYADGVRRRTGLVGGEVLIRGRRRPMVGVVTMDQFVVDCGPDADVEVGDEVVLIGRQGSEELTAAGWASLIDTIGYEIVCGISPRVPRVVVP